MSEHYKQVETFYKEGVWSIARVKNAVIKKWITEEEYEKITGEKYDD